MASQSWVKVGDDFEQLLAGSFVEEMLAEDDKFSESQKLFWIINKVDSILPMIADAVVQWNWYMDANDLRSNPRDMPRFKEKLVAIEVLIQRLQSSQRGFEDMRDRARSLRDGVCIDFPFHPAPGVLI